MYKIAKFIAILGGVHMTSLPHPLQKNLSTLNQLKRSEDRKHNNREGILPKLHQMQLLNKRDYEHADTVGQMGWSGAEGEMYFF